MISCSNRREIANALANQLRLFRWWPSREVAEIYVKDCIEIEDHILLQIQYLNQLFYLPLKRLDKEPENIASSLTRLSIGDEEYIESEYSPDYLDILRKTKDISEEVFNKLFCKPIKIVPLAKNTSNIVVASIGDNCVYVVKSYRKLPQINIEPLVIKILAKEEFKYIPTLYSIYYWNNYVITLVLEYVKGFDGGKPFYESLYKSLELNKLVPKIGLASLVGVEVAEFHKSIVLNSRKYIDEELYQKIFSPEPITYKDLEYWVKRMENYRKMVLNNMDKYLHEHPWIDYWRILFDKYSDKIIEKASFFMEKHYSDRVKARTHQDLHFGQFIYVDKTGFLFTDFEGEPARSDEERLYKEPLLRDIATLIRSLHYIEFFAYKEFIKEDISKTASKLLGIDHQLINTWHKRHEIALLYSYIGGIAREATKITGFSIQELMTNIGSLLYPFIVEKALYEAYYESMYRPEYIPIPLHWLLKEFSNK